MALVANDVFETGAFETGAFETGAFETGTSQAPLFLTASKKSFELLAIEINHFL